MAFVNSQFGGLSLKKMHVVVPQVLLQAVSSVNNQFGGVSSAQAVCLLGQGNCVQPQVSKIRSITLMSDQLTYACLPGQQPNIPVYTPSKEKEYPLFSPETMTNGLFGWILAFTKGQLIEIANASFRFEKLIMIYRPLV